MHDIGYVPCMKFVLNDMEEEEEEEERNFMCVTIARN
jgi:hypothetical protein